MRSAALLFVLVLVLSISFASAATCTVTTVDDHVDQNCNGADCTLREAILEPTCSAIDFSLDTAGYPIMLTMGELAISRNLTITGWGSDATIISGSGVSRIFYIGTGAGVTLSRMTLRDGNGVGTTPGRGGAIRSLGTLVLDGMYFTANTITCSTNCYGAAVLLEAGGTQTVKNSTFAGNVAPGSSGVLSPIPGAGGPINVFNTTIADNTGYPMFVTGANVKMVNSTVLSGSTYYNGGLASLDVSNSIVQPICRCSLNGGITSRGNNIVSTASGSNPITYHASDLVNAWAQLGPLQYNGGRILTMMPAAGGPAVDGGNNDLTLASLLTTDARGYSRFADGGSGRNYTDIGAVEFGGTPPAPVQVAGRVLGGVSGNPVRSVMVAITDFQGHSYTTFSSSLGWFVFDNIPRDGIYRISVGARRGTQIKTIYADHDMTDADIFIPGL